MEPAAEVSLTDVEARVVGCLVEKERTVPETFPLTLNALLSACNQSSNRDPVVEYDVRTVLGAVDSLKAKRLARIVHPGSGSRSTRYRQVLGEALALEEGPLAVLAVLLLRGPQTAAELRTRTERLHPFGSLGEVEAALEAMAGQEPSLVVRLDRRPGEREARWAQLLTGPIPEERHSIGAGAPAPDHASTRAPGEPSRPGLEDRVAALEAELAELRSVVDQLRELL